MLLLIFTILAIILGCIGLYYTTYSWKDHDIFMGFSIILLVLGIIFIVIEIGALIIKPIAYKDFKIKYDVIKEQITNKNDVRDATFTQNIIEINQEIMQCREYIDSVWVGIYENKKICDMELLKKDE